MNIPPLAKQLLVAGSTHLAALSVGGVVAYPGVLLQQFKSNDTIIHVDLDSGSWIGSVHGLAGIPSFLMPFFMQCRGRKNAFLLSCILIFIGWTLTYAAKGISMLIVGECFHGLGGHSLIAISLLTVSEMVKPKYRHICSLLYGTLQTFGMTLVGILGRFLHWKTAGLIMSCPILIALIIGCTWPESPSWLAYKGRFEECERTFISLRGTDPESLKELNSLISAHRERLLIKPVRRQIFRDFLNTITSRNFYMPALHTCLLLSIFYWGGGGPFIVYSSDITLFTTGKINLDIKFIIDLSFFIGYILTITLINYYSCKKVLICSTFVSSVFMISATVITYLQSLNLVAKDSMLGAYCLVIFLFVFCTGASGLGFTISTELMPVQHRGIGGCLYVIYMCIFQSSVTKSFPYLCLYIKLWGAFLIYGGYLILCGILVLIYVPDTRHRTLQELENFYTTGYFKDKTALGANDSVHQRFLKNEERC